MSCTRGYHVSRVFLTEYRLTFPTIRIVTRDPSSPPKSTKLAKLGGELHPFGEPLDTILAGADVVLNIIPPPLLSSEFKADILQATVRNGVKVYFSSEWGAYDYMNENVFPVYEADEWQQKRALQIEARKILSDKVKLINLNGGGFLTWWAGPNRILGWDADKNVFSTVGPSTAKISLTHQSDIGRAAAQVSVLALDPATAARVPTDIRIAGQSVSYEDLRDLVSRVKGLPKGDIVSQDLAALKEKIRKDPPENIWEYVLVLFGEGKLHCKETDNELVNPRETLWKWTLPEDEFRA
ncbi:hypothetical protein BD309DRAFT_1084954 [Dichomitus squalens]|uniref:Uncharacterized protein n=2 Tax=Dichomitus squalens TaxID=114155 RepID=A0A4Q9QBP4_9APHY|nr:hypothetical protein BD309DRAFT_1084954 [Dichomitus squalens]TBU65142.1 hypothetical protein BD310DRAFT_954592 [Dichomitus squalens]